MLLAVPVQNNDESAPADDRAMPVGDPAAVAMAPAVCPICGAMTETQRIGKRSGWTCMVGGYAHYFQAQYGHLERWFTSGEGNLREPVISAMNCAA